MNQSKGAFAVLDGTEFIEAGGDIYQAAMSSPIGTDGYRMGARWLCSKNAWCLYVRVIEMSGRAVTLLQVA